MISSVKQLSTHRQQKPCKSQSKKYWKFYLKCEKSAFCRPLPSLSAECNRRGANTFVYAKVGVFSWVMLFRCKFSTQQGGGCYVQEVFYTLQSTTITAVHCAGPLNTLALWTAFGPSPVSQCNLWNTLSVSHSAMSRTELRLLTWKSWVRHTTASDLKWREDLTHVAHNVNRKNKWRSELWQAVVCLLFLKPHLKREEGARIWKWKAVSQ